MLEATAVTFLGPLDRLHFWHKPTARGYTKRGIAQRRRIDTDADEFSAAPTEARYVYHPFKPEVME